ncbi:hypothetical protein J1605_019384 [Eschrichtius robustus]|uniref:Protein Dr1 n=1 Tax=Eschrichtius robustus TaxID=9764 RepID=A0AB34HRS8_ESCRO|nr:hypothetical protein J1605_019384 [Eschrichtius robustus]
MFWKLFEKIAVFCGCVHLCALTTLQLGSWSWKVFTFSLLISSREDDASLESLGFGSYISEVKEVLQECKTVALKRRKASSRLENLGIPEEELLRQQQELFAKARQQQAELAQQEWLQMQQAAQQAQLAAASASASNQAGSSQDEEDDDDI